MSGIRISDLRSPVLTAPQQEALAAAEREPVELTVEAVLAAAAVGEDVGDFGPPDFRERLGLWLAEIDVDPNRTAYSRRRMFRDCERLARNRLRVVDLLTRHPEIHEIEIRQPVIVVGMPRTGTTHLVNTLAADDRFRSLPLWESREPVPRRGRDFRRVEARREWEEQLRLNPNGAVMHAMHPDHIHEELELEAVDFSSYRMEWSMQMLPKWRDYYLSHDQTPHYEFLRTMLKVVQWQRGPDRWLLKCPQHLEQLPALMRTFPDAFVVMTHRDPVSVVQSAVTMMANNSRLAFHRVDVDAVFAYWVDRVERLLSAGVRDLGAIPDGQRVDVRFDELIGDPDGAVRRIYDGAGIELSAEVREQVQVHLVEHAQRKEGRVEYDFRADFGVDPGEVRTRFSEYLGKFPVHEEVL